MKRIIVLVVLGLLPGCGPNDGRVDVSGTVLVDGQPMEGVTVAFVAGDGAAVASTTTDSGGNFTARVLPGTNKVVVSKEAPSPDAPASSDPEAQTMGTEEQVSQLMKNAPKPLIAPQFSDPEKSGFSFDLQEGSTIEIKVTSQ